MTPSYLRKFIQPRRYQVATTSSSSSASDSRTFKNKYKLSRIQIFPARILDPGSTRCRMPDPHPHQRIKYFEPKKLFLSSRNGRKYDPGCSSRISIPYPCLDFFPHPGSRGQKGIGSRIPYPHQIHCLFHLFKNSDLVIFFVM
jgi:hypothetical protein